MPDTDHDIRNLLAVRDKQSRQADQTLIAGAMQKARSTVGQRDALTFALVRVWTVLAEMLAPLFAHLAVMQSSSVRAHKPSPKDPDSL